MIYAVKYTDKGFIKYRIECINDFKNNQTKLIITVTDTGRGIKKEDIDSLYNTQDKNVIKNILNKYNIALVTVGKKEREKYGKENLEKFNQYKNIFVLLFSSNNESLYIVKNRLKDFNLELKK